MNTSTAFFFDIFFVILSLHSITYFIYGRLKRKALIGGYKPGKPGYNEFLKIVDNNSYLVYAILATILALGSMTLDVIVILKQPSLYPALITLPIFAICLFALIFFVINRLLKKQ